MKPLTILLALFFCMGIVGCEEKDDDIVYEQAVVKLQEGADTCNAFMIIIKKDDDVKEDWYKPENLPSNFQVNGLSVLINYTVSNKKHNCGFGGNKPVIVINHIKKNQ